MHRLVATNLLLAALTGILAGSSVAQQVLPPPPVPSGNPQSPQKILLGKALFWDEQLSSQRNVACGTCHTFGSGGSDPRVVFGEPLHPGFDSVFGTPDDSHGSAGVVRHDANGNPLASTAFSLRPQATGRRSPSVINSAYATELFWDGRAGDVFHDPVTGVVVLASGGALESQIADVVVNDVEMSHIGRSWTDVSTDIANLQPLALADQIPAPLQSFVQGQTYAQLFQQVFGSPGVTPVRIIFALASYERSLVSDQSPFDLHLAGQSTLNAQELSGLFEFQGLCMQCHQDIDSSVRTLGPVLHDFRNIGVRPYTEDPGRQAVTGVPFDFGRFKVPGLRNVALRAPYFHTGGAATLADVVDFYARGGDFHINQDVLVSSIPGQLSAQDRLDLVAFLNTLTDPRVAQGLPPFDHPRLWSLSSNANGLTGQGTPGTNGVAPLAVAAMPGFLGNRAVSVSVTNVPPGIFAGVAFDLFLAGAPVVLLGQEVWLLQSPALTFVGNGLTLTAGNDGYSNLTFAVPADQGLLGMTLHGQWLLADAGGPFGWSSSGAFSLPIF